MYIDTKGERTKAALTEAAIRVVAAEGLAGLSYRKVAKAAGTSLALVNYHFPAKAELVTSVSTAVLQQYAISIEKAIERVESGTAATFQSITYRLLRNAITRDLQHTLAWAEIVVEAARHPESVNLAREWDSELQRLWSALAKATGYDASPVSVRAHTDLLTGFLFLCMALQVDEASLAATLEGDLSSHSLEKVHSAAHDRVRPSANQKAGQTKIRIVEATIDILKEHGAAAISFRAIAERAGLSLAAPSYYFAGIADLLSHSQITLTERSKNRYREVMSIADHSNLSWAQLIDLTATIFVREATQSGPENLVFFANWLEAARRPELRPVIRSFIESQTRAWQRVLPSDDAFARSKQSGLQMTTQFLGKLVRIISTGATTIDLAAVRDEFFHTFQTVVADGTNSQFSKDG